MKYIYNFIAWTYIALNGIVLMTVAILIFVIAYPFDPRRRALHIFSGFWGLHYFWVNPLWKMKYTGGENVDKKKTYVMVCNHQSMFDICLMYNIPLVFKWVSKAEATKIPFIGWLLPMHGDVLIKRGEAQSAKYMMKKCSEWIKKRCCISIFPEGTRTTDGKVSRFKEGAFLLAKVNKLPILPVVMDGSFDIFPKKGMMFGGRASIQVKVLPEISAETVASMGTKDLTVYVQNLITEEHKKIAPNRYVE